MLTIVTSAVCTLVLAVAIFFVVSYQPQYTPPPFEPDAVTGIPEPPERIRHVGFDAGNFTFMIASVIYQQEDGSVGLYLTNPLGNDVYLMGEVIDQDGNTIYRSGLLRPGEYVPRLYPTVRMRSEAIDVIINIYALESEGFFSAGTVMLGNVLQPY